MTARDGADAGAEAAIAVLAAEQARGLLADAAQEARELARDDLVQRLRAAIVTQALSVRTHPASHQCNNAHAEGSAEGHDRNDDEPRATQEFPSNANDLATPERGWYVYAIAEATAANVSDWPPGADTVTTVVSGDLAAVVSEVALARLAGLSRGEVGEGSELAELARAHDAVVRAVSERAAVLPLRFATVVPDRDAVLRLLEGTRQAAVRQLSVVRGCREFGVRLWQQESAQKAASKQQHNDQKRLSGKAYLTQRREALDVEARREERLRAAVRDTDTALTLLARKRETRSAADADVLSEFAYLVVDERQELFLDEIERHAKSLSADGIRLQLTGPWPPYSFVRLDVAVPGVVEDA